MAPGENEFDTPGVGGLSGCKESLVFNPLPLQEMQSRTVFCAAPGLLAELGGVQETPYATP